MWKNLSVLVFKTTCHQLPKLHFSTPKMSGFLILNWGGQLTRTEQLADCSPISLLSILCKIFERFIYKDLFTQFYCNNLLKKIQSGFMPGHSCIFWLLSIVHEINSFLDCNVTRDVWGVLLDISKAFDEGLLLKLESCGIGGELLNLFKDYLQEHQQRVYSS